MRYFDDSLLALHNLIDSWSMAVNPSTINGVIVLIIKIIYSLLLSFCFSG
jgi:hypothetical protein